MYAQLPRPAIFAHRGSSAYAPENTLAAFDLAISQNADAIEFDAKLSADGHVVVIHDQTIDRTTNGSGFVNQLPLKSLKGFDAGSKFDPKFSGEKIPTLDEVLANIGKRIFINIEIIGYPLNIHIMYMSHKKSGRLYRSLLNTQVTQTIVV